MPTMLDHMPTHLKRPGPGRRTWAAIDRLRLRWLCSVILADRNDADGSRIDRHFGLCTWIVILMCSLPDDW